MHAYHTPEVVKGTKKTEDGLELTGLNVYLPSAGGQVPAVRIVATGLDRFMRFQNGYAVFALERNGKRETVILPARQEKGKETGNIIWSAAAKPMSFPTDEEGHKLLLEGLREARQVVEPVRTGRQ